MLAPILLIVYTRLDHLKKSIESIKKNKECEETILYISSDGGKNIEDKARVKKIRDYSRSINGFKSVEIIEYDDNLGGDVATNRSREYIFSKHETLITIEDDNLISPLFLSHMNNALKFYKNDSKIFSVCGFSPYIMSDKYDSNFSNYIFFNHSWAAWGSASWKEKFNKLIDFRDSNQLLNIITEDLTSKNFIKSLNTLSPKYYINLLYSIKNNKIPEFDFLCAYYCLKNNLYNVYSYHTFSKNFGHDGSGLRSLKDDFINHRMEICEYAEKLPKLPNFNKLLVLDKLPLKHENKALALLKIVLIKIGLFDFFKSIHRKFYKKIV